MGPGSTAPRSQQPWCAKATYSDEPLEEDNSVELREGEWSDGGGWGGCAVGTWYSTLVSLMAVGRELSSRFTAKPRAPSSLYARRTGKWMGQ